MNRLFKTLLLWLLVAILPLHAVGAAMPMSCTPAHHQAMQKPKHDETHQARGMHHEHDAGMAMDGHHHDAKECHHVTPDASVADGSSSSAGQHAGCSACAAGCIGAAAPPLAWFDTPAFGGSEAVLLSPSPLVVGYTPNDFERPPKSILA